MKAVASEPSRAGSGTARTRSCHVCLKLLDGFELRCAETAVAVPMSAQRVVALVALRSHPVNRMVVAGTLWSETSEEHAHASLRSALWRLGRSCPAPVVEASRTHLRLSSDVAVDVRDQVVVARQLLELPSATMRGDPREVLEGELLPDWYDEWVLLERERLRHLRLHALEALVRRLLGEGKFAQAAGAAFSAVSADPLRESAQRVLIEAYLAEGNSTDAVRQYRAYRLLLHRTLGLEPSIGLTRLIEEIARSQALRGVTLP